MDKAGLTRIFCARPQNFAWFLGAGTSRSAGLPTATDIIWDLKRMYYCAEENQDISRQDIQLEPVRARIQSFMDSRGFPAPWSPEEYGTYFEKIFGADLERHRRYLHEALSEDKVRLAVGHRVLGSFLASDMARAIFSTNFDSVVEKALAEISGRTLAAFHLEGSQAANQALNNEEFPLYCKLHGDFRYERLKNLPADLKSQNDELAECFVIAGARFGFVVCGYSGRDESIIELFHRVLAGTNPFPHGLFWTDIPATPPMPAVVALLDTARSKGVNAHYVSIETFDTLMLRLWRNTPNKSADLDAKVRKARLTPAQISLPAPGSAPTILRLNALPLLTRPTECLAVSFAGAKEWADIRQAHVRSENQLILSKASTILSWGSQAALEQGFGEKPQSITAHPLPTDLGSPDNLTIKRFMEDGLCAALVRGKPLLTRATRSASFLIVDRHAANAGALATLRAVVGATSGVIPGLFAPIDDVHPHPEQVAWAEAVRISIDVKNGEAWLLVDPDIWIWPHRARELARDFLSRRRGDRFNQKYNAILDAWIRLLVGSTDLNAEASITAFLGIAGPENPCFVFGSRTGFARRRTA
jgi:hypothetical protein